MEGDLHGVRVLPPRVEFKDTQVDTLYQVNITVKNISKSSKEIRYWGPQSKVFLSEFIIICRDACFHMSLVTYINYNLFMIT